MKNFGWSFVVLAVGLVLGWLYGGPEALVLVLVLSVLEISLSFDNAVVNATILERMNRAWQRIFLTVGVVIAVFGMRLVFPFLVVAVTAGLGPVQAIQLAFQQGDPGVPGTYGFILNAAHPSIAGFGGMFLLMLFLDFMFDEREILWIKPVEKVLQVVGRVPGASTIVSIIVLVLVSQFVAEDPGTVLLSGVVGIGAFLLVTALGRVFEDSAEEGALEDADPVKPGRQVKIVVGKAAFFLFLYLEVLDASFSFDGVIGAFAITSDPIVIAIGLGVGAMFIRSLTIFLVRQGTLSQFVYLEHGALWAVGALAVILLISIRVEIPDLVTGLVGIVFIGAGFLSSVVSNRRAGRNAPSETVAVG
ncbi:DUF475 domain-containing protein [Subtercola boreus]|uniref:DUF475 domain-containing protein n=1 Tax=Subtercola boreus TaxID=120213 RepID=A0A3E0W942_9MICO|nr:DUF475 domain-containing protein [Subtercola boreus]RFA19469.1 hypothetical protein B7R24_12590 [Subtercola boreus]RFA19730.1 hypothetical protein B7R23_12570 [Subtercola boreus]RFA26096.1 hypothetical protein B7R25_12690 [Subtercola boreus]